jgi:hypothetical protein
MDAEIDRLARESPAELASIEAAALAALGPAVEQLHRARGWTTVAARMIRFHVRRLLLPRLFPTPAVTMAMIAGQIAAAVGVPARVTETEDHRGG